MSLPLSFALLGCGSIAQKHAIALTQHLPDARLVAVCDCAAPKAQALGEQYGVPWFTNLHEMMQQMGEHIDVVNILTPSGYHAQNVLDLAPYGKHLCVEKPIALTLDDTDAMIDACDRAGVRLFAVHQNRFNIPVQKLRHAIEQGRFGRLLTGSMRLRWSRPQSYYDQADWRGTWALDGGVFANQAYHFVDLLQWLMGEVDSVTAKGVTQRAKIEAEDTGVALLSFCNGALGLAEATTAAIPDSQETSLTILGESATVELAGFSADEIRLWQFAQPESEDATIAEGCRNPAGVRVYGHVQYFQSVIDTLLHGAPPAVDAHEARRSLALVAAIYESMASGQPVRVGSQLQHSPLGIDRLHSNSAPQLSALEV